MYNITLSFGKRVRKIRQSQNISQEKLAELSGLHSTYIGQIERGEKCPTLESISKIAEGLEISLSDLFCNIGENKTKSEKNYVQKVYDEMIGLDEEKKEKLYKIICGILEL